MAFHITTSQFSQAIRHALDTLHSPCDPEQPNLHLSPRLISCDGPSLTLELSDTPERLDTFQAMMRPFSILEVVRTGVIAVQKGGGKI